MASHQLFCHFIFHLNCVFFVFLFYFFFFFFSSFDCSPNLANCDMLLLMNRVRINLCFLTGPKVISFWLISVIDCRQNRTTRSMTFCQKTWTSPAWLMVALFCWRNTLSTRQYAWSLLACPSSMVAIVMKSNSVMQEKCCLQPRSKFPEKALIGCEIFD